MKVAVVEYTDHYESIGLAVFKTEEDARKDLTHRGWTFWADARPEDCTSEKWAKVEAGKNDYGRPLVVATILQMEVNEIDNGAPPGIYNIRVSCEACLDTFLTAYPPNHWRCISCTVPNALPTQEE